MKHESRHDHSATSNLTIAALGVVYGDIGTSPLYAFKQSIEAIGGPSQTNILAILSLMIWSLIMVVTIKYVFVILRANNNGEGGTIALTSIALGLVKTNMGKWTVLAMGLFGVSMFYGDSIITPAISVLSAIEGLKIVAPRLESFIIPITMVIIAGFFAIQRFGTGTIGKFFGPIMIVWFVTLGLLGLMSIIKHPQVLMAINPAYGLGFMLDHPAIGFAALGAVVLSVTGGEALYADMGHFGIMPIRRTWFWVVLPALVLNYAGQGALLLEHPEALESPFYLLAPKSDGIQIALIVLAAMATIIASQAVISGAFSLTNQAVQLGYIPRLKVNHTSSEEVGQVYVNHVNLFLFICVELLVMSFRSSDALANAYGIAVTGSMAIDTLLGYLVIVKKEHWNPWLAFPLFLSFLVIDLAFFSANTLKFFEGGWFPIAVAGTLFFVMIAWNTGRGRLLANRMKRRQPLQEFLAQLKDKCPERVPGTAVFMVPDLQNVPHSLLYSLRHYHVLHQRVILLNVKTEMIPWVKKEDMIQVNDFHFKLEDVSFFIGTEHLVNGPGNYWIRLADAIFIFLHNNMYRARDFFQLPHEHVVEVGGQIEI
ncbi:MAG: potassium transporter Kup [Alphaproteobacteria bacterium]|nr:potassium transporter Kup [Alphaproteobacteria bacterium]